MHSPPTDEALQASLDDIEFLVRSNHRVDVLNALAEESLDRTALRSKTGASSPTMGRILTDFRDRRWLLRNGPTYELTYLGEYIAEQVNILCEAMATERKLRDVWQWLPREMEGFTVDLFADAVVSYPGPGYPYEPIGRVTELIRGTDRMRAFGSVVFKSINNEAVCRAVLDGMELEYVYSPSTLATTFAWDPDRVREAASCENCTVYVHDDLPDKDRCGLGIVDSHVGICGHDAETGDLRAIVDTDASKAREWAISVFERVRREAEVVDVDALDGHPPSELAV